MSYIVIFALVVFTITINIFFYRNYYISYSKFTLFFSVIKIRFVLSMILLIFRNNLILLFIGWDGLGITSYFLVVFYQNWKSQNAGIITILSNRLGDSFLMCVLIFVAINNSISYSNTVRNLNFFIFFLIIFMAFTKRAQFPFSSWLPAAIAAPTPISALVHSSTLVTAGVFLLLQFYEILSNFLFFFVLLILSSITLFYRGGFSLWETDLKKIVALSTLNQLALIFFAIRRNLKHLAFLHLNCHACFKSLLFINTGVIIHFIFRNQDSRLYNFSKNFLSFIITVTFISLFNLLGIRFRTGFFSKDFILENNIFAKNTFFILFIFYSLICFTFFYSFRLFFANIFLKTQITLILRHSFYFFFPIFFLSCLNIFFGKFWIKNIFNFYNFCGISIKIKNFIFLVIFLYFFVFFKKVLSLKVFFINYFSRISFLNNILSNSLKIKSLISIRLKKIFEKTWLEIFLSFNIPSQFFSTVISITTNNINYFFVIKLLLLFVFILRIFYLKCILPSIEDTNFN